jgi:cell division septal protein FtsQ
MKHLLLFYSLFCCPLLYAQSYKIGIIEVYGNRKIDPGPVYSALNLREGDSITENFQAEVIITTLKQIPGIKYASINPVCCDTSGNWMLFIGIGETDSVLS